MDNNMKYIMEHLDNAVTELEKVMQVMLPPEYAIYVDNEQVGLMETNMSGKLSFSVELPMPPVNVKVVER